MKTLKLLCFMLPVTLFSQAQTVTDIDGNVYQTVTIGNQVWMAENLRVTHYQNGDSIPLINNNAQWSSLTTGAYSNYNNTLSNVTTYGRLYNWYVVNDSRLVAPKGWHVPSDSEWYTLANFLGDSATSGAYLKEAGTTHWTTPNSGATNSSGFTGLPGGYRDVSGYYNHLTLYNNFWSTTVYPANPAYIYHRGMAYNNTEVLRYLRAKNYGFSIRCVKDAVPTGMIENTADKISVYPNPVQNNMCIEILKEGVLQIINVHGQIVCELLLTSSKNDIDVSGLARGVYSLKVVTDKDVIVKKIVKQ